MAGFKGINKKGAYAYISTASITSCSTNVWTKLAGTFNNEIMEGFSVIGNVLTHTGCCDMYEIKVNGAFDSNTSNTLLDLALFKNGALQENSIMSHELNSTADTYTISLIDVLELKPSDSIEIYIRSDRTANVTANTLNTSAQCFYGCERI